MGIKETVNEIKEFAKEFRSQNGNSSLRVPNKDFNLWLVKEIMLLRSDVKVMKMKTKLLMYFFGICIALIAFFR